MKWSMHHLNVFRVQKHWIQRLQLWKSSPVPMHFLGRHCKKVFHNIRNMILNLCIALQITIVVICKTICLVPRSFLILFSYCYHFAKSSLKWFKEEPNASNSNVISDMEEYTGYILQIEQDAKLSKRILRNVLNSITQLLQESEKKEPRNLMKLLEKSTRFNGVVDFDNDGVPPLHPEETQNCWGLIALTLTAIALALPNIANCHVKGQEKARKGKTLKEILEWLGDEAAKFVIQFKARKNVSLDHSRCKFIAADLLCACFTNLPYVITMKCHDDAIEKREDSIRTATQLLGRSKKILKMLKKRQLPNLDMESMGYIDKWRAVPKS
ncbi:unnamed protein product [Lactuca virosa]|uniref:Uncharacterized protein n=1 Tax=Lactuca virosa TaxID=75947 RepID=A0AAU9MF33_9ASTR|nr:unnamed protein product [Lactuca virosa]